MCDGRCFLEFARVCNKRWNDGVRLFSRRKVISVWTTNRFDDSFGVLERPKLLNTTVTDAAWGERRTTGRSWRTIFLCWVEVSEKIRLETRVSRGFSLVQTRESQATKDLMPDLQAGWSAVTWPCRTSPRLLTLWEETSRDFLGEHGSSGGFRPSLKRRADIQLESNKSTRQQRRRPRLEHREGKERGRPECRGVG